MKYVLLPIYPGWVFCRFGLQRVDERDTWRRYTDRMMTLSRIYGFWRYVSNLEREETQRYLEMLYTLQFRPLAKSMKQ